MVRWLAIAMAVLVAASTTQAQEIQPPTPSPFEENASSPDELPELPPESSGPSWRLWAGVEALGWAISGQSLPPLVTGSPTGTPREQAGILGAPGTQILYGDQTVNGNLQPGIRTYAGLFLGENKKAAVEGSFFTLYGTGASWLSPEGPIVARPFTDAANGQPNSALVNLPGVVSGLVGIDTGQCFYGLDVNLRRNLRTAANGRFDLVAGYRNMGLTEGLGIYEYLDMPDTGSGTKSYLVSDNFWSKNIYNGGQIGLAGSWWLGRWAFDARALLGLGGTSTTVCINGSTTAYLPTGDTTYGNGLLARQQNIGEYTVQRLSFVPEVALRLSYQLTPHMAINAGYTFLYWTGVARPANQIDSQLNLHPSLGANPQSAIHPTLSTINATDIWIQGVSTGLEFRF